MGGFFIGRTTCVHPDEQRLGPHLLVAERGEPVGLQHDRDIELAAKHLALQQLAERGVDLDLDARMAGGERLGQVEPVIAVPRDEQSRQPRRVPLLGHHHDERK